MPWSAKARRQLSASSLLSLPQAKRDSLRLCPLLPTYRSRWLVMRHICTQLAPSPDVRSRPTVERNSTVCPTRLKSGQGQGEVEPKHRTTTTRSAFVPVDESRAEPGWVVNGMVRTHLRVDDPDAVHHGGDEHAVDGPAHNNHNTGPDERERPWWGPFCSCATAHTCPAGSSWAAPSS